LNGLKPAGPKYQARRHCCAEFRKVGKAHHRVTDPWRHFCHPVGPLLSDGAPRHENWQRDDAVETQESPRDETAGT
jgi:hypothetical protein